MSSIASSLGVPESPGQSLLDLVINYLRTRRMLLIIDNFEHVVAAAGMLAELIAQTDQAVLLITSRERLRLLSPARRSPARHRACRLTDQGRGTRGAAPSAGPQPQLAYRRAAGSAPAAADATLHDRLES